ncbi:hypothetical protein E0H65_31660 [Rhizobium leguminosarum bv. viciae]|nr:hypothetical protein [Rhizobium leguminosarum]TCA86113.1 hypothetical protein E0H65_31660 [Rhizobium leguminosarum bv. viciae]
MLIAISPLLRAYARICQQIGAYAFIVKHDFQPRYSEACLQRLTDRQAGSTEGKWTFPEAKIAE